MVLVEEVYVYVSIDKILIVFCSGKVDVRIKGLDKFCLFCLLYMCFFCSVGCFRNFEGEFVLFS